MTADLSRHVAQLFSSTVDQRRAAADELLRMGPAAAAVAPALVAACADEDAQVRTSVAAALEDLGMPEIADVAHLARLCSSPVPDVAYWAVTLLGRLADRAATAVGAVSAVLQNHQDLSVRQRAAWALGHLRSPSPVARMALQAACRSSDPRLARLAREAIERLPAVAAPLPPLAPGAPHIRSASWQSPVM